MADIAGVIRLDSQTGQYEDLSPLIEAFGWENRILIPRLPKGAPITESVFYWDEDALRPDTISALGSKMTTSATTFTPNNSTDMSRYKVGERILVGSEVMRVTAVGTSTVTVSRAFGATTAVAHSSTATVTLLGKGAISGADAGTAVSTLKVKRSNYYTIEETVVHVADDAAAFRQPGVTELAYQKQKQLIEHLKDIDKGLLYGTKQAGSGSSTPPSSGGIMEWITTANTFAVGAADTTTATLTYKAFVSSLATIYDKGATPDLLLANGPAIKALTQWADAKYQTQVQGRQRYGVEVTGIDALVGHLDVVYCPHLRPEYHGNVKAKGVLVAIDRKRLKYRVLADRGSTRYISLAKTGHADKGMIRTIYGLERRNADAHAVWHKFNDGA